MLLLVEHLIKTSARNAKLTMNQLEKEARLWAKEGCTTKEAALDYLRTKTADYDGARQVVKQLGPRRPPSLDEEALYRKWTEEWGFSLEEVLRALRGDHQDRQPQLRLCGRGVEKAPRAKPAHAPAAGGEREAKGRTAGGARQPGRGVRHGDGGAAGPLRGLAGPGLRPGGAGAGGGLSAVAGKGHPQELETLLVAWQAEGLTQGRQVREHLDRSKAQNQALQALFRAAGIRRSPTREDRAQLKAWQEQGAGWSCCCWRRSMRAMRTIPSP